MRQSEEIGAISEDKKIFLRNFQKTLAKMKNMWYNTACRNERPVGQAVKTLASHAEIMGSIPVRVTKNKKAPRKWCFFVFRYPHNQTLSNSAGIWTVCAVMTVDLSERWRKRGFRFPYFHRTSVCFANAWVRILRVSRRELAHMRREQKYSPLGEIPVCCKFEWTALRLLSI